MEGLMATRYYCPHYLTQLIIDWLNEHYPNKFRSYICDTEREWYDKIGLASFRRDYFITISIDSSRYIVKFFRPDDFVFDAEIKPEDPRFFDIVKKYAELYLDYEYQR